MTSFAIETTYRVRNNDAYNELSDGSYEENATLWVDCKECEYPWTHHTFILHVKTWLDNFVNPHEQDLNETYYLLKEAQAHGAAWIMVQRED